jgi:hypothetical protein
MIIRYFYIERIMTAPNEANPVLIVNADAVLTLPVAV